VGEGSGGWTAWGRRGGFSRVVGTGGWSGWRGGGAAGFAVGQPHPGGWGHEEGGGADYDIDYGGTAGVGEKGEAPAGGGRFKRKWFQVTRRLSLLPNLHARFELVTFGLPGTFRVAPRRWDLPTCASQLRGAPASRPMRNLSLEAAFHSPAWTFPLPVCPGGVNAPALLLRLRDAAFAGPVCFYLAPRPVSRTSGEVIGRSPLPAILASLPAAQLARRSPSGFLPLGISAPSQACDLRSLPSETPDFLSLPAGGIV
jgi:hypothetical protein